MQALTLLAVQCHEAGCSCLEEDHAFWLPRHPVAVQAIANQGMTHGGSIGSKHPGTLLNGISEEGQDTSAFQSKHPFISCCCPVQRVDAPCVICLTDTIFGQGTV